MREREEVVELAQPWRRAQVDLSRRHIRRLRILRFAVLGGATIPCPGRPGLLVRVRPERRGARDDVEQPADVPDGVVFGVVLCLR